MICDATLIFQLSTARSALPVQGASVLVTDPITGRNTRLTTDQSGRTRVLCVTAPPLSWSQTPGSDGRPYSIYHADIRAEGYIPVRLTGIQVFAGQQSLQTVEMVPCEVGKSMTNTPEETIGEPVFLLDALVPFRLLMGERILPWQGVNGLAILLLAWWGGYCAEGLLNPQTSPRRRQVMWTVFASAFFLQFLLGVTVASSLLMTGKLHIPVPFMMISGPVYREEGFFMLALFSVSVLMAGSSWCSHLCYFGVWDCLAAASSRRKQKTD